MRLLTLTSSLALISLAACATTQDKDMMPMSSACDAASYSVYFDTAETSFDMKASDTLNNIKAAYMGCDLFRIELEGHADSVGSSPSNLKLSEDRAQAVATALGIRGVSADRIRIIPMGERETVFDGNENAYQRKVDIRLVP